MNPENFVDCMVALATLQTPQAYCHGVFILTIHRRCCTHVFTWHAPHWRIPMPPGSVESCLITIRRNLTGQRCCGCLGSRPGLKEILNEANFASKPGTSESSELHTLQRGQVMGCLEAYLNLPMPYGSTWIYMACML